MQLPTMQARDWLQIAGLLLAIGAGYNQLQAADTRLAKLETDHKVTASLSERLAVIETKIDWLISTPKGRETRARQGAPRALPRL
jgi:hypothetical protein